jgi:hypothetical protein
MQIVGAPIACTLAEIKLAPLEGRRISQIYHRPHLLVARLRNCVEKFTRPSSTSFERSGL